MAKFAHLLIVLVVLVTEQASACQPLPQNRYTSIEERVKERYDGVDAIELATLQRADVVKVKSGGIDFEMDAERAVFRVDRVFKGKSRPGDTLVFTSFSSCAFSVVGNRKFKIVFDASTGTPVVPERQWLIYRHAKKKTEITDSDFTRPIDQAFSDIGVLERLSRTRR